LAFNSLAVRLTPSPSLFTPRRAKNTPAISRKL
jgi:hypothetical protein